MHWVEEVAGKELAVLVGIAASVRQVASFESVVVGGIAGRGSGYQCKPHFLFVLQEELLVVVEVDWLVEVGAVQLVVVEVGAVAVAVVVAEAEAVDVEQQLDWCTIDTSKDHLVSTSAGEV